MRQFILAKDFKVPTEDSPITMPDDAGKLVIVETKAGENVGLNLVLKRTDAEGGDILYPIYPKDFTWNVAEPGNPTKFRVVITVPDVNPYLDYSVIFTKKGKLFNERANWTATVHTTASSTKATVAAEIAKFVNNNSNTLGLTATVSGAAVTVLGPATGEDYAVTAADELPKSAVATPTAGKTAFMDAAMVQDLMAKCAADMGYEYTEESDGIYPNYPFKVEAGKYKVYTLRFTEPRLMGTREEAVYQIIQVAFPNAATLTGWEDALDNYVVDVR